MEKALIRLNVQLKEIQDQLPFSEKSNPAVSKVPVGWHLLHSLKVIFSVLKGLEQAKPDQYRKSFSWKKELVFFTGRIPRGKARAPKFTRPPEAFSKKDIQEHLENVKARLQEFERLPENAFFDHPYFGHVHKKETLKFLIIHTEHHLKITREILK